MIELRLKGQPIINMTVKLRKSSKMPIQLPVKKLDAVPKDSKIYKRPLVRPQKPASSNTKLIYVSSKSPFMSVVTRVRKELEKSYGVNRSTSKNLSLSAKIDALKQSGGTQGTGKAVVVMGTGKAITKTLSVASWYSQQSDCSVDIKTKTTTTIDDIIDKYEDDGLGNEETRCRSLSCLVVTIRLR